MKKLLLVGILLLTACARMAIAGCPLGPLPAGYSMIANPCDSGAAPITAFLPVAPEGTTLYKWNGVAYEIASYFFGAWEGDVAMTLSPGEGAFILLPLPAVLAFVGAPLASPQAIGLPADYAMRSAPAGLGMAGFPAVEGDTIYKFDAASGGYEFYEFFDGIWFPAEPVVGVGEGFWVLKVAPALWGQ
jgi:hypothetical protein